MAFNLALSSDAERDLDGIDRQDARRIIRKLRWFAMQEDPLRHAIRLAQPKLGDIRFRIGEYRALAVVDMRRHRILILAIGHRRDIYRR